MGAVNPFGVRKFQPLLPSPGGRGLFYGIWLRTQVLPQCMEARRGYTVTCPANYAGCAVCARETTHLKGVRVLRSRFTALCPEAGAILGYFTFSFIVVR